VCEGPGKTVSKVLLDLMHNCFSHGHLLVGATRTRRPKNLGMIHKAGRTHLQNPINRLIFENLPALLN